MDRAQDIVMDCTISDFASATEEPATIEYAMQQSLASMLEVLVFKNTVECTSQRLKWTSGARVMIIPSPSRE